MTVRAHTRIIIVGTGFSGLGAAIRLRQEGINDFVILERASDLGGTWLRNVAESVVLFELRLAGSGYGGDIDPVCRMPVDRDAAAGKLRHDGREYWFCSLECTAQFAARPASYVAENSA